MSSKNVVVRIISGIWRGLDGFRKILHLLLLLVLFLVFFGAISEAPPQTPKRAALLLQPVGALVEQLEGDPYERALAELLGDTPPQTLIQDVVDALEFAKTDDRITAVHLELSLLGGGGLSKLQRVASALDDFRESGKPVIASADYYGQNGYYLAAHADELYMHPEGIVFLQGYGAFRNYFKEAIETLRVDWNVFRVGTHKSFVEPYTRMDMSPEDRESRMRLISQFWDMYQADVENSRGLAQGSVENFTKNMVEQVTAAGGDIAVAAHEAELVDDLLSRGELRAILKGYAGEDTEDESTYSAVHSRDYLGQMRLLHKDDAEDENVAVVIAAGNILDGTQSPGTIGGDSTAALLRSALTDETVKAVVLRVDSPGGSVFASEVIADEVRALRAAGKPVVASMGSVAASGGYWVSVVADKIVASPATVTGSIGVFGMFPTYQRSMQALGVNSDGVGTTPWAGQLRPDREMSAGTKDLFQLMVEDIYNDFLSGVAEGRSMEKQDVDTVAQGQVWSGIDALEFGLVDQLGTLEDSVRVAAELAGLDADKYGQKLVETQLSPTQQMVLDFLSLSQRVGIDLSDLASEPGALKVFANNLQKMLSGLSQFNDPKGLYSHCFCEID